MGKLLSWVKRIFKKDKLLSTAGAGLFVIGALLTAYALFSNVDSNKNTLSESQTISLSASFEQSEKESSSINSLSSSVASSKPEAEKTPLYPTDRLFLTKSRQEYQDGTMVLRVPRLELEAPVMGGTDAESLKKGVGLYEYAQLPGEGNCNVSIAGHRDIYGCEFYYIDTVTDGDLLRQMIGGRFTVKISAVSL